MTIKVKKETEQEITVTPPMFWKSGDTYTALLDESTAINFYIGKDYTAIQHATPEELKLRIEIAHNYFSLCAESEWMEKYNEVLKSISLQPILL
jgi:hypothetical protein